MSGERVQRRLAAILAIDVVGYSQLMERDEAGTLAQLKLLRASVIDPSVQRHFGRIVKLMGDGALIEFGSAVDAVTCALEIQAQAAEQSIQFRIGINVGDVIVDGDDIYGDGVNLAARIEASAEPGSVYISRAVADQVRDKISVGIESRGIQTVKNIARPVELFCVGGPALSSPAVTPPATDPGKTSIAVLAFTNMSGDADQDYFSDGISEDIITDLAKLSELHVIARNSSFVYKNSPVSVPEVAAALGVRYVLEGSVRKAGNKVRVTAQLIDAKTGGHAWAERFDRDLSDIFAVQDELTQNIVAALKVTLTPSECDALANRHPGDIAAYDYFLRGREQMWLHTRAGNVEARGLMERVLAIEPDHAAARAIVAFSHVNDYANGWAADPQYSLSHGLELASQAVAMDENEPECHFAMSMALLWSRRLDEALLSTARCIELKPSAAAPRMIRSHTFIFSGRGQDAVDMLETYFALDPHYPDLALHFLAEARFALSQFDLAYETIKRRIARTPGSATAHALLASICGYLGRIDDGLAAWALVPVLDPGYSIEQRRRTLPFKNPDEFERRVDGLRKLGIDIPARSAAL